MGGNVGRIAGPSGRDSGSEEAIRLPDSLQVGTWPRTGLGRWPKRPRMGNWPDVRQPGSGTIRLEQRAILVLRHYLGLEPAEIAETLGIKEGTARSRLHYATARCAPPSRRTSAASRWPEGSGHDGQLDIDRSSTTSSARCTTGCLIACSTLPSATSNTRQRRAWRVPRRSICRRHAAPCRRCPLAAALGDVSSLEEI